MKKAIKKTLETIMTFSFIIGFICLFGESQRLGTQALWTGGSLLLCIVSERVLDKLGAFDEEA